MPHADRCDPTASSARCTLPPTTSSLLHASVADDTLVSLTTTATLTAPCPLGVAPRPRSSAPSRSRGRCGTLVALVSQIQCFSFFADVRPGNCQRYHQNCQDKPGHNFPTGLGPYSHDSGTATSIDSQL